MKHYNSRIRRAGSSDRRSSRAIAAGVVAALVLLSTGCNTDRLMVPNYNSPTGGVVSSDPSALQLISNGIVVGARSSFGGWISLTARIGREAYSYTPTEGRNTTTYLMGPQDPTRGAGNSAWAGYYSDLTNLSNFKKAVEASTRITEQQKKAATGFADTFAGYSLSYVVLAHGDFGGPVEIMDDPRELSPWVTRDSIYNNVIGRLEEGKANLAAGGSSFPFALNPGFALASTPSSFLKFNRAIAARINAYRASFGVSGCGAPRSATCYQTVLANINESFLNTADLSSGVDYIYSTAAGDSRNPLSDAANAAWVAHPSIKPDAQLQADGSPDQRYIDKIKTLARPMEAGGSVPGIPTDQDFIVGVEDPIPAINSEELLLLRSEAKWFTGDKGGAIADLNIVRTTSGKLPPSTLTAGSSDDDFITALLYERRYSLLDLGHRWVDVRRFGRLNSLPLDLPVHVLFDDLIIPQSECLIRKNVPPSCA